MLQTLSEKELAKQCFSADEELFIRNLIQNVGWARHSLIHPSRPTSSLPFDYLTQLPTPRSAHSSGCPDVSKSNTGHRKELSGFRRQVAQRLTEGTPSFSQPRDDIEYRD